MSTTVLAHDRCTIHCGNSLDVLKTLPDESVHCCVTSPPYWGLRDYGADGQLGLESTPEEYVAGLVAIFGEVKRVLRDDGTLWLNLGDSYAGGGTTGRNDGGSTYGDTFDRKSYGERQKRQPAPGLKPKDLCGIPWMVAFALRADGWWLRQDIIWHKLNPMPSSVTDRCTTAHEYIFLLSKSAQYYYCASAIKEKALTSGKIGGFTPNAADAAGRPRSGNMIPENGQAYVRKETRNKRSVWTVPTKGYPGAHFATYNPALIEPCILAGCPKGGTALDPFMGSGTTAQVALELDCNALGIELNPEYCELIKKRLNPILEQTMLF